MRTSTDPDRKQALWRPRRGLAPIRPGASGQCCERSGEVTCMFERAPGLCDGRHRAGCTAVLVMPTQIVVCQCWCPPKLLCRCRNAQRRRDWVLRLGPDQSVLVWVDRLVATAGRRRDQRLHLPAAPSSLSLPRPLCFLARHELSSSPLLQPFGLGGPPPSGPEPWNWLTWKLKPGAKSALLPLRCSCQALRSERGRAADAGSQATSHSGRFPTRPQRGERELRPSG